jgi:hypothetical protein
LQFEKKNIIYLISNHLKSFNIYLNNLLKEQKKLSESIQSYVKEIKADYLQINLNELTPEFISNIKNCHSYF